MPLLLRARFVKKDGINTSVRKLRLCHPPLGRSFTFPPPAAFTASFVFARFVRGTKEIMNGAGPARKVFAQ
jgi:hypothetical protein